MEQSRLKVTIFGTEYALKADSSYEYIQETAAYIDKTMKEIAARLPGQADTRVAVLAALNIAEELFQARRQQAPVELEGKILSLAETLNLALED